MPNRWPDLPAELDRSCIILCVERGDLIENFEENILWLPEHRAKKSREPTPTESDHTMVNVGKYRRYFELYFDRSLKAARPVRGRTRPPGIVFGSGTRNLVHFRFPGGKSSPYARISRQHFSLCMDPRSSLFYLVLIGDEMVVNRVFLNTPGIELALNPEGPNEITVHGIKLQMFLCHRNGYCADTLREFCKELPSDPLHLDHLELASAKESSFTLQIVTSGQAIKHQRENEVLFYNLKEPNIRSQSGRDIHVVVHALRREWMIAKTYHDDFEKAIRQFELISTFKHALIAKYLSVENFPDRTIIFTEFLEGAKTLDEFLNSDPTWIESRGRAGRHFLFSLLTILGVLHNHDIIHDDISPHTVLVIHLDDDHADIRISGFSHARRATGPADIGLVGDCQKAFEVILRFQERLTLGSNDLGNPYLNDLLEEAKTGKMKHTVREILDELSSNPITPWEHVRVSRGITLPTKDDCISGPDFVELFEALLSDTPSLPGIRSNRQMKKTNSLNKARQLLEVNAEIPSWIPKIMIQKCLRYLKKQTDILDFHRVFQLESIFEGDLNRIEIYAPLHLRTHKINLSTLLKIAGTRKMHAFLDHPLLSYEELHEVWGDAPYDGIYVSTTYLEQILHYLGLSCDDYDPLECELSWPKSTQYIIIAHRDLGDIGLLHRESRIIRWGNHELKWNDFLVRHCIDNESILSKIEKLENLRYRPWKEAVSSLDESDHGHCATVTSQSDSTNDQFKFRRHLAKISNASIERVARVESWVEIPRKLTVPEDSFEPVTASADIKPTLFTEGDRSTKPTARKRKRTSFVDVS